MIGSPDLLAFTGTEGFGEGGEDHETLPEELSVPLVPPSHPWTSSAQFHRDFILVAEFSEQVCTCGERRFCEVKVMTLLIHSRTKNKPD